MKTTVNNTASKAKKALSTAASTAAKNPLPVLYVVGGGVALYAIYQLLKATKDAGDALTSDPDAGGGATDISNPSGGLDGATINNAQAQVLAAQLLEAFHTIGGVNNKEFEQVKNVFRGKNAQDYALITKAFGEPRRSPITGEASVLLLGGVKSNLAQWLALELDNQKKLELTQIAPKIFS